MCKKFIFSFLPVIFFFVSLDGYAQETKSIEELKELYLKNRQIDPFLATEYAAQALQLATEANDSIEIAIVTNYLGDCYFSRKAYSMALDKYFTSYKIFQGFGKQRDVAFSLIDIGNIYFEQNLSSIAKGYYESAKEIFDVTKDKEGLALVYDKIGFVHLEHGEEDEALKFFINAHYFRKSLKDPELLALSNQNIAEVYLEREEYEKAISFLNNALENFKDDKYLLNVADIDMKIGDIYDYDEHYKKALFYYKDALKIHKRYKHRHETALLHNRIAETYLEQNKLSKSKLQCIDALNIAYENDFIDIKAKSYLLMSEIFERQNNIRKAYDFQKRYAAVTDSIIEVKQMTQSAEMQVSYEIQQQENEIAILTKDQELSTETIAKQKIIGFAIGGGAFLLLVFAIFLYRSNLHKQRTNKLLRHQKRDIEDKNAELEIHQKAIEDKNKKIEKINKNITGSINYASRIQKAMLPKPELFKDFFKDAFVFFKPREKVSGDFYWISKNDEEEKVIVAAVDCTGHGVPGAFMSLIGNSYLNQIINTQKITTPDLILNLLHINIRLSLNQEENQSRDGMDIALCVIDYKNNTIEFSGARNPMFFILNNELVQVRGDNMDIGGMQREKERRFNKQVIPIEKGMCLYLFSDGYQDQFGGKDRQKYMRKRFKEYLLEIHKLPMDEQRYVLEQNFEKWRDCGDGSGSICDQIDDVLVIGLQL
jgi:serine phosphatase RsbU (regulator of sigma subunit)/tetratricopeptide (TPR) repeat protein